MYTQHTHGGRTLRASFLSAVRFYRCEKARPIPLLYSLSRDSPSRAQRLAKADLELRRLVPEAEALLGGVGSAEELAQGARGRLVTTRQQASCRGLSRQPLSESCRDGTWCSRWRLV